MGAYYKAVCVSRNETVDTWLVDAGAKMMEHSYIGGDYLNLVLHNIEKGAWKNEPLVWACDYDDSTEFKKCYEGSNEITFNDDTLETVKGQFMDNIIILNNTKKEYIDLLEYQMNYVFREEYITHPFSLLTCAVNTSQGGGDYYPENADRSRWAGDKFSIIRDKHSIPFDYENISNVCFSENENEFSARKDILRKESLAHAGVQVASNEKIHLDTLKSGAKKGAVVSLLRSHDVVELTFKKADGVSVMRNATLDVNKRSTDYHDDKYMFFYDLDSKSVKKMVFDNFIEAKVA